MRFLIIAASGNGVVKMSTISAGIIPDITSGLVEVGLTEVALVLAETQVGVELTGTTQLIGETQGVELAGTTPGEELTDVAVGGVA